MPPLLLPLTAGAIALQADRFGRRMAYAIGSLLFLGSSVGCICAHSIGLLLGFRALQGLAGEAVGAMREREREDSYMWVTMYVQLATAVPRLGQHCMINKWDVLHVCGPACWPHGTSCSRCLFATAGACCADALLLLPHLLQVPQHPGDGWPERPACWILVRAALVIRSSDRHCEQPW